VFKFGEFGKKFYIILEGSVSVIVPFVDEEGNTNMITVAQLGSGVSFGELALIKDQPRAASILCATDCHMAVLLKEDYMKIIGRAEARKLDKTIELLKEIPFFSKWSKRKLEKMTYYFQVRQFKRKDTVFKHGTPSTHVYIVKSGEFELNKPIFLAQSTQKNLTRDLDSKKSIFSSEPKQKNFTVKVALLGKGEMFCEEEVIKGKPNVCTCNCFSPSGELFCITSEDFLTRFYKKSEYYEDTQRMAKYLIREKRISNFKDFLESKKIEENNFQTHIILSYSTVSGSRAKPKSKSKGSKFVPLNKKQIDSIRHKALGFHPDEKIYMNIYTPVETTVTEETIRSASPGEKGNSSFSEMLSHRPGGYYRAKLKKPAHNFRNMFYSFDNR
jgi:CRP-like cAMP-binding protein